MKGRNTSTADGNDAIGMIYKPEQVRQLKLNNAD